MLASGLGKIWAETLVSQLPAGGHADLSEDVAKMPLDGTWAKEQAAADLPLESPR
jgi:hypothetical protein